MQRVVHIDHSGSHGVPPIHSHGAAEPHRRMSHDLVVWLGALVLALALIALVTNGRSPEPTGPRNPASVRPAGRRPAAPARPGTTGQVAGGILGSASGRDAQSHLLEEEDALGGRAVP